MVDYTTVEERVEHMLYDICGCNLDEGKIVLEDCLKKNKDRRIKND